MALPPTIGDTATTGVATACIVDLMSLTDRMGSILNHGLEGEIMIAPDSARRNAASVSADAPAVVAPV